MSAYGAMAYSGPDASYDSSSGNNIVTHLAGNDDAMAPGIITPTGYIPPLDGGASPDIDVHTNLKITVAKGQKGTEVLYIAGGVMGDNFPSAEAFVKDKKGNAVFLGVSPAGYGPNTGPFLALWGDNRRPMIAIRTQIVTRNGVFIGVMQNGKMISISEWNKQFERQKPKEE
jgi:hypothetical protein